MNPIIQNIVCTCNIGSTLYLPQVVRRLRVAEYNPKRFAAVTFRLHYPTSTALIFSSGKIVCTGTKSRMMARLAMLSYVVVLHRKLSLPDINVHQFVVQNMVASASVGHTINLRSFYEHHSRQATYDADLFPGLIYRDTNLPAVILLFESGKMVITGAKKEEDVFVAYNAIVPIAYHHLVDSPDRHPSTTRLKEVLKHVKKNELPVLSLDDFAPILNDSI
jgi:transcription initiation factor TFIID TATA-box-binding protein